MKISDYWPHLMLILLGALLGLRRPSQPERNPMNAFLKACLKEAFDLEQTGAAALSKSNLAGLLPLLLQSGEDLPALVSNWASAKAELEALLKDPASDADLIAYGLSLGWSSDAKVQAVIADVSKLVLDVALGVEKLVVDLKA